MGWITSLNKFIDKVDPITRWTENKIFGEDDPTFGAHKNRTQPGYTYTPQPIAPFVNPMTQINPMYTSQAQGDSLAPMQMYKGGLLQGDSSLAPMQMYQAYKANQGAAPGTSVQGGK